MKFTCQWHDRLLADCNSANTGAACAPTAGGCSVAASRPCCRLGGQPRHGLLPEAAARPAGCSGRQLGRGPGKRRAPGRPGPPAGRRVPRGVEGLRGRSTAPPARRLCGVKPLL
eukprot:scaffold221200_cov27-Prasinocladus_malaysianus.AAC.1